MISADLDLLSHAMASNSISIIGAGSIGLYAAIRLAQVGYNVHLIDRRLGHYTRPGTIERGVFRAAEKILKCTLIDQGDISVKHIKDFERALYKQACDYPTISFYKADFLSMDDKAVTIADATGTQRIPCSFVFDASGAARAVVNFINKTISPPPFEITSFVQNPIPTHFIAFVKMKKEDIPLLDRFQFYAAPENLTLSHFHNLQDKYGWKYLNAPTLIAHLFNTSKNKVLLYGECPDALPNEKLAEWILDLLKIKTQSDDISFQLDHHKKDDTGKFKKPVLQTFQIAPDKITNPLYIGKELLPVVAVGDAAMSPHYQSGRAIENGMGAVENVIRYLTKKDISPSELSNKMQNKALFFELDIKNICNLRQKAVDSSIEKKEKLYANLLVNSSSATESHRINIIKAQQWFYQKALYFKTKAAEELKKANNQKNILARNLRLEATIELYTHALEKFQPYPFAQFREETIKVYSNLAFINNELDQYSTALNHANTALSLMLHFNFAGKEQLEQKVQMRKLFSLSKLAHQYRSSQEAALLEATLKQYEEVYTQLFSSSKEDSAVVEIQQKMAELQNKGNLQGSGMRLS